MLNKNTNKTKPLQVTPDSHAILLAIGQEAGWPIKWVVDSLSKWIAGQTVEVRESIIGYVPERMRLDMSPDRIAELYGITTKITPLIVAGQTRTPGEDVSAATRKALGVIPGATRNQKSKQSRATPRQGQESNSRQRRA